MVVWLRVAVVRLLCGCLVDDMSLLSGCHVVVMLLLRGCCVVVRLISQVVVGSFLMVEGQLSRLLTPR